MPALYLKKGLFSCPENGVHHNRRMPAFSFHRPV
jgi:hypothetical protein